MCSLEIDQRDKGNSEREGYYLGIRKEEKDGKNIIFEVYTQWAYGLHSKNDVFLSLTNDVTSQWAYLDTQTQKTHIYTTVILLDCIMQ